MSAYKMLDIWFYGKKNHFTQKIYPKKTKHERGINSPISSPNPDYSLSSKNTHISPKKQ